MRILIAIAVFISTLSGLSALISAFDRRFMLVEYGQHVRPCAGCGRSCLGTRCRAAIGEPWGEWHSECCGTPLSDR